MTRPLDVWSVKNTCRQNIKENNKRIEKYTYYVDRSVFNLSMTSTFEDKQNVI